MRSGPCALSKARKANASPIGDLVQRNKFARQSKTTAPHHGDFGDFFLMLGLLPGRVPALPNMSRWGLCCVVKARRRASVARRSASASVYLSLEDFRTTVTSRFSNAQIKHTLIRTIACSSREPLHLDEQPATQQNPVAGERRFIAFHFSIRAPSTSRPMECWS